MSVVAVEGVVENGQIRLKANLVIPEKTKVYVVIPDVPAGVTLSISDFKTLEHPEREGVDDSDVWTEEDLTDVTVFSLQYASAMLLGEENNG